MVDELFERIFVFKIGKSKSSCDIRCNMLFNLTKLINFEFIVQFHYKTEQKQDQNSDQKSPVNQCSIASLKEFFMIMDHCDEVAIISQTFIASLPICYCPLFSHKKQKKNLTEIISHNFSH